MTIGIRTRETRGTRGRRELMMLSGVEGAKIPHPTPHAPRPTPHTLHPTPLLHALLKNDYSY
ncbi:hypothetical protein [Chroococcidiopsis thermalis]|uniref:hypothetical protein n=1 Tax=Chroococcidiopsis thermalis TaxID=54299 RepID=UPI0002F02EF9|nr:hypothetical protein [Chroococcidiopsis thermalis]